jgi:undecaprenyl-diphosphatase
VNDLLSAFILGIVEGATEFIPVSSTGHLILAGHWLGFTGERANLFEIVIQLGAILAVVWQYREMLARLIRDFFVTNAESPVARRVVFALVVAFLPAALVGLATHKWITAHLFRPVVVAWALVVGGLVILLVERLRRDATPRVHAVAEVPLGVAFGIGLAQVLSLIPGTSRSAATIIGALVLGVARPAATEFSFLLAIPVMFAASGLGLVSDYKLLHASDLPVFAIGFVTAFASALIAIRWLLRLVAHRTFEPFAWYRIAFGAVLLVLAFHGLLGG